jgi:poly(hydroxyalkanoate) granule-associated protein
MTKKLPAPDDDEALARAVRASAQQIWQAGLGAFAKAQEEGGRSFTRLVRDGSVLARRTREVEEVTDTVARAAERASRRGSASWGKLEQVFEERVARALATIGVPAASEVEALRRRVDELELMLAELATRMPAGAETAPGKASPKARVRRPPKPAAAPSGDEGA